MANGVQQVCDRQTVTGRTQVSRTLSVQVPAATDYCFRAEVGTLFGSGSVIFRSAHGAQVVLQGAGTSRISGVIPPGTYTIIAEANAGQGSASFAFEFSAAACP